MLTTAIEAAKEAGKFLKQNVGKVKNIQLKAEKKKILSRKSINDRKKSLSISSRNIIRDTIFLPKKAAQAAGKRRSSGGLSIRSTGRQILRNSFPVFCVSIGVEHKGELIAGVIYDPNFDELFTAERGNGASQRQTDSCLAHRHAQAEFARHRFSVQRHGQSG